MMLEMRNNEDILMNTTNWINYHSILLSVVLLIVAFPVQATEPLWITETTSADEIVAALTLPSNPNELYRDIVDIVDKHPKIAIQINFEYDSSALKQRAKTLLGKLGRVFQGELSEAVFILAGHADSTGAATYNLSLSLKRATAVQTFLINKYYLQEVRLILKAYGENKPIATNLTIEGRAKNRRVEFIRVK
jgi:outer membrane protein OmpA-like peptidoglycan-associated protein